jgi:signal transduction histidine kinase
MELFAVDDDVAALEQTLLSVSGTVSIDALLQLAWQLRQRDTARALALARHITARVSSEKLPAKQSQPIILRLRLIAAEAQWLDASLDLACEMAQKILSDAGKMAAGEATTLIRADAHYLLAWIAHDLGDGAGRDQQFRTMAALTENCEPNRTTIAHASLARFMVFSVGHVAAVQYHAHFGPQSALLHPAAKCWVEDFLGLAAHYSDDYEQVVEHNEVAHTLALRTGQIRHAIIAGTNQGENFSVLHDYQAALEYMQNALALARKTGWPRTLGNALFQTAQILCLLHRYEGARKMLQEALAIMAPMANSRTYAVALRHLGKLELDCKQYQIARATLEKVEQRACALGQIDLQADAQCDLAQTLLALGQPQAALQKAKSSLAHPGIPPDTQIKSLLVTAEIHAHHNLPLDTLPNATSATSATNATSVPNAPNAALHYLHQALELSSKLDRNLASPELFDALARETANIGNYQQAYEFAMQAKAARDTSNNREATNRAIALQIQDQTGRAEMESEYHRQLAAAEASKAELSQQTSNTLSLLGTIGQEITAHLDTEEIFQVLHHHVHDLLDTTSLTIYRFDADTQILYSVFDIEDGQNLPQEILALAHPRAPAARCARERCEIMLDWNPDDANRAPFANSQLTLSGMFAPLVQADKLLGVISIQSTRRHAYGKREELIFRSLCAYTSIALGNALSHQQVQETQAQLIHSEKMASLGQLVANIAHEINTPIGAIKSSGGNITDALEQSLTDLPKLFKLLSQSEENLFLALVQCARTSTEVLSSREERELTREVRAQLQQMGIPDHDHHATTLVQLHAQSALSEALPLLLHPQSNFILKAVQNIAVIINNTSNINLAVERVSKIVFALKSFAHNDEDEIMRSIDLRDALETVLMLYQHQIKQGVALVRRFESHVPLLCFPDQLNQVWTNLIHNALQAMSYKGTLTLHIARKKNEAMVAIKDTGCGIAPEIRDKIFTPFFTTKARGEGSGLGLDIVKKIIDKHHGRIEIDSEVGVGTTFSVYLPCAEPLHPPGTKRASLPPSTF